MIKLYDYKTQSALPAEMQTPERIALAYAFDKQKQKFIDRIKRVYIWADLDHVDDDKLDFLAVESRVLFYNSDLAPDIKRSLIRNSIYWYMKLGTRQVMEELVDTVFGNDNTSVEEWYTYAGEPFHFRIAVGTIVTQASIKEFLQYLNRVKNARSRLDYMVFQNGITLHIKQVSDYQDFVYTFCGEMECGAYPDIEIGLQPQEINITLEGESGAGSTVYTPAGTTPDISIGAALMKGNLDIVQGGEESNFPYPADAEAESGTYPDPYMGLSDSPAELSIEPGSAENNFPYPNEEETGVFPDVSAVLKTSEAEAALETAADSGTTVYEQSGTIPDPAVGSKLVEVAVDLNGGSGAEEIIYPTDAEAESGSYPDPAEGLALAESGVSATPGSGSLNLYYSTDADKEAAEE